MKIFGIEIRRQTKAENWFESLLTNFSIFKYAKYTKEKLAEFENDAIDWIQLKVPESERANTATQLNAFLKEKFLEAEIIAREKRNLHSKARNGIEAYFNDNNGENND
jgi:hypothetical protein